MVKDENKILVGLHLSESLKSKLEIEAKKVRKDIFEYINKILQDHIKEK